jgi:pentatricopeptide repeat protein
MQGPHMLLIALIASVSIPLVRSFPGTTIVGHSVSAGSTFFRPISLYSVSPIEVDKQTFQLLEETTRDLLNGTKVGEWDSDLFEDAQEIMEVWSHRQSRRCALTAERILLRIVEEQSAGNPHAIGLEMATYYSAVIEAWANSGEDWAPERAEEILDYMQNIYADNEHDESFRFKPQVAAFNSVLLAYARANRADAPQQAIRVLAKIYDWYTSGRTDVLPNKETYAAVLGAFAKNGKPDSPIVVRQLLVHMEALAETYPSVRPDYSCHNAYIAALLDSRNCGHLSARQGAKLANDYLNEMMSSLDDTVRPNTWTFNMVISAWSRSGEVEIVERAEELVEQLEAYHEESGHSDKTRPNCNTYNCLIACYGRSKLPSKATRAHDVLRKMQKLAETGDPSIRPDTVTYNSVMNAYAKTRKQSAPHKVEELLREMGDIYKETGDRRTKPNTRSFNTCLDAWAKSGQPGSAARIMEWIELMNSSPESEQRNVLSNKWTYNAYLQALSKSGDSNMGIEAERILVEMESWYQRGNLGLKPDVMTFTNVIHCIALSGRDDALERALASLNRMEDLHSNGFGDVRPNLFTYNCVINAAAKSKRAGKAKLALKILRRMESVAVRPATVSYNNVLNACAFSSRNDNPIEVLQSALVTLREAQEGPGANWITYQTVLRVVCTFEQDGSARWQRTREIFRQCCEDGQLTSAVMTQVKFAVSSAQFAFLLDEAIDERTGKLHVHYTVSARRLEMAPTTKKIVL